MRSVGLEVPFFGRKVHKMGQAIPSCTTAKTRKLMEKQPNIQLVRSKAIVFHLNNCTDFSPNQGSLLPEGIVDFAI
jgi:hypothetical protein